MKLKNKVSSQSFCYILFFIHCTKLDLFDRIALIKLRISFFICEKGVFLWPLPPG